MGTLVRLKRFLTGAESRSNEQYVCLTCHTAFEYQQQACPECGGFDIRSIRWLDERPETRPPDQNE